MVLEHLQQMDLVNQQNWNYNKPFTRVNTWLELLRSLKIKAFKFQFHRNKNGTTVAYSYICCGKLSSIFSSSRCFLIASCTKFVIVCNFVEVKCIPII